MPSFLSRVYPKPTKKPEMLPHLAHEVIEMTEGALASYGFGYVQNRWREKASLMGVPADLLAGLALKGAAFGMSLMGKGTGMAAMAAEHVNNVGQAGVSAYFHTLGAGKGAQHAGTRRLIIADSDVAKVKAVLPNATILGVSQMAPKGDVLSRAQLNDLS